ncbi:MAG: hypothetical protein COA78_05010 [Blastopirellula sp.]|nr:MAG: hypothetical protein COA78_05010 [Blastopirellula sp.]
MLQDKCPSIEELRQLVLGDLLLETNDPESIEDHLLICDDCSLLVDAISNSTGILNEVVVEDLLDEGSIFLSQAMKKSEELYDNFETIRASETIQQNNDEHSSPNKDTHFLSAPEADDEIGRLGDYRILKVLGSGGMGVVFLAEELKLKRQVALKALRPLLATDNIAKNRFLKEAQAVATIDHENIVHINHVSEEDGIPVISMPYLKGKSLQTYLKQEQQLQPLEVARMGIQIARGLTAAHQKHLVHRDIKPGNIWIEEQTGLLKILDFGLVRTLDDRGSELTFSGYLVGTPAFMSPEQAEGEDLDHRSDLFSFGTLLYSLITGKSPFDYKTTGATLGAVINDSPTELKELHPEVCASFSDLVMRLLSKNRDDRPATTDEVLSQLIEIEASLQNEDTVIYENLVSTNSKAQPKEELNELAPLSRTAMYWGSGIILCLLAAGFLFKFKTEFGTFVFRSADYVKPDGNKPVIEQPAIPSSPIGLRAIPSTYKPGEPWAEWAATAPAPAIMPFTQDEAKLHQQKWAEYLELPVEYTNSLEMKFRLIPPGETVIGLTEKDLATLFVQEKDRPKEGDQSAAIRVRITQPYYLASYELTHVEYSQLMDADSTQEPRKPRLPENAASYQDATKFCDSLSLAEELPTFYQNNKFAKIKNLQGYRIPTEAEWEFGCRAGSDSAYSFGNDQEALNKYGWSKENSSEELHEVGELLPNAYGLFDMHGNVWEYCNDFRATSFNDQFKDSMVIDPTGAKEGTEQIIRGGSHNNSYYVSYSGIQGGNIHPARAHPRYGIRVALSAESVRQLITAKAKE